jgi:DEAD/DEAH box helicase domain-containing protein
MPIAVFLDGFRFHKQCVADDSAKRLSLVQSGRFRVWSLTWDDVQGLYAGKLINSRNPFAERLNPEMQAVQNGLLQRLSISELFNTALLPPVAQLLHYLAEPNAEVWQGLAFVRLLGWFDQAGMREKTAIAEVQKQLRMRSPSQLGEQIDTMKAMACCRFAEKDDPLEIDCIVPLDAISDIQADLALGNLWLDDSYPDTGG